MKKLLFIMVTALNLSAFSQQYPVLPNKDYVKSYADPLTLDPIESFPKAFDLINNVVYQAGSKIISGTNEDMVLLKYDSDGNLLWSTTYDYNGKIDRANAVAIDGSGNVYITGISENTVNTNAADWATTKYNSSGTLQWTTRYNANAGNDVSTAMVVDASTGDVYVCGYGTINAQGNNFTVIKYNTSGTQQWLYSKNGSSNSGDRAQKLILSGSNVFVTGYVTNTGVGKDIYTACLSASAGTLTWSRTVDGSASGDDIGFDIKLDVNGDVMVGGQTKQTTTNLDLYLARLANATGTVNFTATYDGGHSNGDDIAKSIVCDGLGNYAITGQVTNGSNYEYHTRMYNSSGTLQWTHTYLTNGTSADVFPSIARDTIFNYFYVCGSTYNSDNSTYDGVLYSIAPNSGTKSWEETHNGVNGFADQNVDMVLDGIGRVYISAICETTTGIRNLNLIRYSQTPAYIPVDYNSGTDTFSLAHLYYPNTVEILDTSGAFADEVLFYGKFSGTKDFILKDRVVFCSTKLDSLDALVRNDSVSRIDMVFQNANEFARVSPFYYQDSAYLNYFMDYTGTNGTTIVKGAAHLMIPNIYPMIDLHISSNQNGPKYYFVVKPEADPSAIFLKFDGASSSTITSNELKVNSKIGSFTFKKPDIYTVSYDINTSIITTPSVTGTNGWVYTGTTNTYSFNVGTYNDSLPLVIEFDLGKAAGPDVAGIEWSTYLGGSQGDYVSVINTDIANTLYVGGITNSPNFPAAQGFQATSTGINGFIARFNSVNGQIIWSTYFGGNSNTSIIKSLDISPTDGDIYCIGQTLANNIFIKQKVGAGINDNSYNGSTDSFIFQLKNDGATPMWSTYYGTSGSDELTNCKFDSNGNFFMVGTATSTGLNVSGAASSYTSGYVDGNNSYDGYIMKLAATSSTINWATYIGSSTGGLNCTADVLYDLDFNRFDDVYVVGYSIGTNYTVYATGGATSYTHGACDRDGIISEFSNTGQLLFSSYYGGTGDETIYAVKTADNDDVYFGGYTLSSSTFPTLNSGNFYFNSTKASTATPIGGFFVHYNSNNVRQHSTLIGGNGKDQIQDITTDGLDNVYLMGVTSSTNIAAPSGGNPTGIYATQTNAGMDDYLIFAIAPTNTNVIWSTLIGGDSTESNNLVFGAIDNNNRFFLSGTTRSPANFPWDDLGGPPAHFQGSLSQSNIKTDASITRFNLSPVNGVGIKEYTQNKPANSVFLYPNPTQTAINIKIDNFKENSYFYIYNSLGQIVSQGKLENSLTTINVAALSSGMYFFEIKDKNSTATAKFVKYD